MRAPASVLAFVVVLAACGLADNPPPLKGVAPSQAGDPAKPAAESAALPAGGTPATVAGLPDFTQLVKSQGPAVVNVVTARNAPSAAAGGIPPDHPLYEFFRRFVPNEPPGGAPPAGRQARGIGSGFIISADGHILTNAHLVAEADTVVVRLADAKREFRGRVVGVDERTDVALLKVDAQDLPVARLGASSSVQAGEWVAAIGSPFGLANTITAGIVSAVNRTLPDESFVPFIQTDVAVNPGNSGGPLLNMRGEVIGINSMIYSGTGGYMGLSFAIPIEVASDVAKQLQSSGRVTRSRLGIGIQPLTQELARSFGLDAARGVLVASVESGSPADKAGLRAGDVVLQYDGKPINEPYELPRLVAGTKPGTTVAIEVWRDRAQREVKATVEEATPPPVARKPDAPQQARPANALGLAVSELPPADRERLKVKFAVRVDRVEGPAESAQIRPGDAIVAVNEARFQSMAEFEALLAKQPAGEPVALLVQRGGETRYLAVAPQKKQG